MPAELAAAIREAADAEMQCESEWMAGAVREHAKRLDLREILAEWQAEHGAFTEEEKAAARARLNH